MSVLQILFNSKGRISRQEFWKGFGALVGACLISLVVLARYTGVSLQEFTHFPPSQNAITLVFPIYILSIWPGVILVLKRLKDLSPLNERLSAPVLMVFNLAVGYLMMLAYHGRIGSWEQSLGPVLAMLMLTVISVAWLLIDLGCMRGNNEHDPDPLCTNHAQEK